MLRDGIKWFPVQGEWAALGATAISTAALLWFAGQKAFGDLTMLGYINAAGTWTGAAAVVSGLVLLARRYLPFALLSCAIGVVILWSAIALPLGAAGLSAGAPTFRLITASLRNLNTDMESAATVLLAANADILVVQESDPEILVKAIRQQSGQAWSVARRNNELILCRCRIANVDTETVLSVDVELGAGRVRIWNVRAPKAYRKVTENRLYFQVLAEKMRQSPAGIAAGDFNATPWNDGYRIIAAVASDSWRMAGFGTGFTFPTRARRLGLLFPLIRIDHVFMCGNVRPIHAEVGSPSTGADHFPVLVEFQVEKDY